MLPGIDRILSVEKTGPVLAPAERKWLEHLRELVLQSTHTACERVHQIEELSEQCAEFADIEYDFLYDSRRRLLAIGFNVSELRRDGASTIFSRRKHGWQALWPSPKADCRRSTGSRWAFAHLIARAVDAAVVERIDVRVSDAAAGDAYL